MWTVILLTISNVFMTFAWYYHLKHPQLKSGPLWFAILASWGIALFEYCFQVPGNRLGAQSGLTIAQLKIMQEAITLGVFLLFVWLVMGERLGWNHYVGFGLVFLGVVCVFAGSPKIGMSG
ncbi:MAG: DMT family protein [Phycisphaerae bacterium]|nr:DMT family protein [Phycisphaerae bacterium]MDW8262245.1 DMT family protein [Phycisphaerales bacterium]